MQKDLFNIKFHKKRIAYRFNKAANNYDKYAHFQRLCGYHLCKLMGHVIQKNLLDAGCGTGWFSRYWKAYNNQVTALDISKNMLLEARKKHSANMYILGDIESMPFFNKTIDVVFSNLALQWSQNISQVLSESYRILKPGGILALSTLAHGSLIELQEAWKNIDNYPHINNFLSVSSISDACSLYRHQLSANLKFIYYENIQKLLHEIRGIGANYLYNRSKLKFIGKKYLNHLEKFWPCTSKGFRLSYHVVYGVIYRD
ncbi:MAG: malonyl-ACP O-methyltransferase BioC [Wigglesworthia glossinidia]|nr:malonyl-ACP O-methyltransferase BioC [Wigglesworthia glossinidia]